MKKILITGARSGIAKRVIDKLKNKNYYIYATTHTKLQAQRLKELYKDYDNIECFKLDIQLKEDREQIKNLNIDILLCNAAISNGGSLTEIDVNLVRENYEVNVFSNLELIQLYLRKIINRDGKIIIMSSLAGIIPLNFIGSYSSTKASLIKIAETLKNEIKLINKNIKVCLIEPGIYLTGFNKYMFMNKYDNSDTYFKSELEMIKLKENLILKLLGQNNYDTIVNKIIKAIDNDNPKFIYRAPLLQVIGAKVYSLIKE